MMNNDFNDLIHSSQILAVREAQQEISHAAFWQDVAVQKYAISQQHSPVFALWEQDSYEFLVLFFAGLLAGKRLLLPPARISVLEQTLAQQQIYFLSRQIGSLAEHEALSVEITEDFIDQARIDFYTSGSTGEPKRIERTLRQLLNEVRGLEQIFQMPKKVIALATVSHQHIYGLLFKVLWPLVSGRSFYSPQLAFPEDVVAVQSRFSERGLENYLISSPALLKRWTTDISLVQCCHVFSSGGKLDNGIRPFLKQTITEILGSSETGGIGYRYAGDVSWQAFSDVEIAIHEQRLMVRTVHAYCPDWIETGDLAEWQTPADQGQGFVLLGRADRIIKLEEKRLSLDAIEQATQSLPEVEYCHALLVNHEQRQLLACVVVLDDQARQQLQQNSRHFLIRQLKQQLHGQLEQIAIPRLWRFLTELPQNTQSKLDKNYLQRLFKPLMEPVVLQCSRDEGEMLYRLEFTPELECFKGHFPGQPIYPGVGQIGFVQTFARQAWADLLWCNGYEQLKFQQVIVPYSIVELKLRRTLHKVSFEMRQQEQLLASGRLLFALDETGQGA